jgi:hypothetical protein
MKRFLKIVAGVVLLLLGLGFTVRAVMGTVFVGTPSRAIAGLINLPFIIPGVLMIIVAVVLLRMARN